MPGVGHGGLAGEAALVGVDHGPFTAGLRLMQEGQLLLEKGEEHGIAPGLEAAPQPLPAVAQAAQALAWLLEYPRDKPAQLLGGRAEPVAYFRARGLLFLGGRIAFGRSSCPGTFGQARQPVALPAAEPVVDGGIAHGKQGG